MNEEAQSRWPTRDDCVHASRVAAEASSRLGLVFGQHHGLLGRWLGPGIGSSIEFEDHRPFTAGDDPRYLDWAAYARSGQLISKVYREEVAPEVDVVIDLSASMFLGAAKRQCTLALMYFVVAAARRGSATVRVTAVAGTWSHPLGMDAFVEHRWIDTLPPDDAPVPDLRRISWRPRSLRVVISDLLFDATPRAVIEPATAGAGRAVVFAPYAATEVSPDFGGACRLEDVESRLGRVQNVDAATLDRYRSAYARHFELWRDTCRRSGAALVRVNAASDLVVALQAEREGQLSVVPWT